MRLNSRAGWVCTSGRLHDAQGVAYFCCWLKSRIDDIAAALRGRRSDEARVQRHILGVGMAGGLFAGLAGYVVTGRGWWFIAPFVGIALSWRAAFGRWPFGKR